MLKNKEHNKEKNYNYEILSKSYFFKQYYSNTLCLSPPMIKISPNLGGGLGNGYKIFELFYIENRFLYFIVKTFF